MMLAGGKNRDHFKEEISFFSADGSLQFSISIIHFPFCAIVTVSTQLIFTESINSNNYIIKSIGINSHKWINKD